MHEDTHVIMSPRTKGLVLKMEHERSSWTIWLELRRSLVYSRSWPASTDHAGSIAVGRPVPTFGLVEYVDRFNRDRSTRACRLQRISLSSGSVRVSGSGRSKGVPDPAELRPGGENCMMYCTGSILSDVGVNSSPGIFSGSPQTSSAIDTCRSILNAVVRWGDPGEGSLSNSGQRGTWCLSWVTGGRVQRARWLQGGGRLPELAVLHTVCREAKQLRIKLKSLVGGTALYLIVTRPVEVYGIVTYM
jgi:hypothetical protein